MLIHIALAFRRWVLKGRKPRQKSCSVKPWLRMHRETWIWPCLPWKRPWKYVFSVDCSGMSLNSQSDCTLFITLSNGVVLVFDDNELWPFSLSPLHVYFLSVFESDTTQPSSNNHTFPPPLVFCTYHRLWSLWIRRTWQRSNHTAVPQHWWRRCCRLSWPCWIKSQPGQRPRDSWVRETATVGKWIEGRVWQQNKVMGKTIV